MKISEQTRSSQILGYLAYGVLAIGGLMTFVFVLIALLHLSEGNVATGLGTLLGAAVIAIYTAIIWAGIKIFVELCDNVQVIRDYIIAISNNEKIEDTEE